MASYCGERGFEFKLCDAALRKEETRLARLLAQRGEPPTKKSRGSFRKPIEDDEDLEPIEEESCSLSSSSSSLSTSSCPIMQKEFLTECVHLGESASGADMKTFLQSDGAIVVRCREPFFCDCERSKSQLDGLSTKV